MKNFSPLYVGVAIFIATGLGLQAQSTAANAALPNLDKRSSAAPSLVAAPVGSPTSAAAEDPLRASAPGVRISRDTLLGSPRYIAAPHGFLSGPGGAGVAVSSASLLAIPESDSHRQVEAFVNEHKDLFGFDASAIATASVARDYVTEHNGLHTTVWQQTLNGIEVFDALFISHVTRKGELVSVSSFFVADPPAAANRGHSGRQAELAAAPPVAADQAIALAAANLGAVFDRAALSRVASEPGVEQNHRYRGAILRGEADVKLVWLPRNANALRLAWWVTLAARIRPELYSVVLDAETGEILIRRCLTSAATKFTYNVYTSDSPSPMSPGLQTPGTTQPATVARELVTLDAINTNASPDGWISSGTDTRGNNVDAHLDRDDNDLPDLPRPSAVTNAFDFPLDLSKPPLSYGNASVVNLFYWNNYMHDKLYELGFTEAAGNFQNNNYSHGGRGNDAVQADAQDGANLSDSMHQDNSNFSAPRDGLPGRMQMYLFPGSNPARDGCLDAEAICHEYGHGWSTRLLGGGVGISELQPSGLGEGWSDFLAMSLLSESGDDPQSCYAFAAYVSYHLGGAFDRNYFFGIRRYPYSTDMSKNPLTLKDIDPSQADAHAGVPISSAMGNARADEAHAMGEVWCVALWEARANLIEKYGFALGNRLMLQLVHDGLRLAPANATFLEARDAIIKADEILTGGDNRADLWIAFAKRGMGASASVPAADAVDGTVGVVETYNLPADISLEPEDGILEVAVTPAAGSVLISGTNTPVFVRVTDGRTQITNATLTASVVGAPAVTFLNNGKPPDATAGNSTYSAFVNPPLTSTSVTMQVVIAAPSKVTRTNNFTYPVVPPPPNDNFTNALKLPITGTNYVTNNRFATTETGEPKHAGVVSSAASLWWNYSSPTNTVLLIDTAGSSFNTIVAVYANQTLSTLDPVVSADDVGSRRQAFVFLNVTAGATYRIAVAGYDKSSIGSLSLNFRQNGFPDTNAPMLTVTSPPDGITVTSNLLVLTGTAVDPEPNPSGVDDILIRVNPALDSSADLGTTTYLVSGASLVGPNWSEPVGLKRGVNTIEVSAVDRAGNQSAPVILNVTYLPQDPPNDYFVLAANLTDSPDVVIGNNNKATKEVGEPNHGANHGGKSVWWNYQAPADGVLTLSTTNSTFDTLLAVYTGNRANALTLVGENDDAYPGVPGGFSQLAQPVHSGQLYHIAVDGYDGTAGAIFLHYAFALAKVYRVAISNGIGGVVVPATADVAEGMPITLNAFPDDAHTFDFWSGDVLAVSNPLTVTVGANLSITANFRAIPISDGFESGDFSQLAWATGGNAPWIVQTNAVSAGQFAARSGAMNNNPTAFQNSSLFLTGNFRAGTASFDYRVSSEPGFDTLGFYVDGVLQRQSPWSGDTGWAQFGLAMSAGTHTLEWRYTKDPSGSFGLDAAFIDNVFLPLAVEVNSTSPANLRLLRQAGGGLLIEVAGQTNQQYVTQASTNLLNWQSISTNVAVSGLIRITDPESSSNPIRFYRAVVGP